MKKLFFIFLVIQPLLLQAQVLTLDMKTLPGGDVSVNGYNVQIDRFQISRSEMTAETAALLLNEAQTAGRFSYPINRAAQIRYLEQDLITINLSLATSPLSFRNREIIVRNNLDAYPASGMTWEGALFICNLLSIRDGLEPVYDLSDFSCDWEANGYRLPTLAEWLYALGTPEKIMENAKESAWIYENCFEEGHSGISGNFSHPVKQKQSNENGLYDMIGNVAEWVWDSPWPENYIPDEENPRGPEQTFDNLVMGGFWETTLLSLTEIPRKVYPSQTYSSSIGLRLVRTP